MKMLGRRGKAFPWSFTAAMIIFLFWNCSVQESIDEDEEVDDEHSQIVRYHQAPPKRPTMFPVQLENMRIRVSSSGQRQLSDDSHIYVNHSESYDAEERELHRRLVELTDVIATKTYTCRKLIRMGGYGCNYKVDGEKKLCLDEKLFPYYYCLVYSIGVGHDLTFDLQMAKFGCDVYAFDSDIFHEQYPVFMHPRLTFYKVRLGIDYIKETAVHGNDPLKRPFEVQYWPLEAVMRRLGHRQNQLYYLKIDIEGSEWTLLEKSIFQTDILEGTVQLSLEIHLEDLRASIRINNTQVLLGRVERYVRIIQELKLRGFLLTHWEPNYKGPEVAVIANVTFHIYSETLWVNPGHERRYNGLSKIERPQKL